MVPSPRGLPSHLFPVAPVPSGPVCHQVHSKLPQFVSPVPYPQAWAVDALSLSWKSLDPYAFPPAAILGKVVEKLQDYPCNRIIMSTPLGGGHIIFAFSAVQRPASHLVSRHFRQQFLSYLYQIGHAGLLG